MRTVAAGCAAAAVLAALYYLRRRAPCAPASRVRSVNFHFLRQCNYKCGFCFHTDNRAPPPDIARALDALRLLHAAGMRKINFSGGEPFLKAAMLGAMCRYCKESLPGVAVSIITNGSLVTERWMDEYGAYVDMLGVSCDSFDEATNRAIGRGHGGKSHVHTMLRVRKWCAARGIAFKLNTVVCRQNADEDMNDMVRALAPARWKVFQCLAVVGENAHRAGQYAVSDDAFDAFVARHRARGPVAESNRLMRNSYVILDESLRFLCGSEDGKRPSPSILDVGVAEALRHVYFDEDAFHARGAVYDLWCAEPLRDVEDLAAPGRRADPSAGRPQRAESPGPPRADLSATAPRAR